MIFNTIQMVVIKKVTAMGVNPFDMMMCRSLLNTVLSSTIIYKSKKHPIRDIGDGLKSTMLARCLIGTLTFYMLVLESSWLPIFIAQTINNMMPFFSGIFGFLINGEKIKKALIYCMVGCFVGIVVLNVYRPEKQANQKFDHFNWGMVAGFTFVVGGALVNVLNRKMKSIHFSIIQFDYAFIAWATMFTIIVAEYALYHNDKEKYPYPTMRILTYDFTEWLLILAYALSNFFVQLSFNIGSTRGKSAFVALIMQIGVVWSFLADFVVLGNPIQAMQIVGALIIVVFNITAIALQFCEKPK